jgi:hypothetical protein
MVLNKSLDDSYNLIAATLCDVQNAHGAVFNTSSLTKTLRKVRARLSAEGIGFLTKTLPRLGKALDRAFSDDHRLNSSEVSFDSLPGTELPRFLGEFFSRIFKTDGSLLQRPCAASVGALRQVLYCYYKYELPYADVLEQQVINKFERTEDDLSTIEPLLDECHEAVLKRNKNLVTVPYKTIASPIVARRARRLLWSLFREFDPKEVRPRHGPGAVATKQKQPEKFLWSNVSEKITSLYPLDSYFYASLGHVCDHFDSFHTIDDKTLPARVILVPKDSRGPRLISCEPVDFQWIQQGLGGAIVDLVERHPLTRDNVRFTDQEPNRFAALYGSESGLYSTLDLNEASDRVSLALVRLLFPSDVYTYLEACRTTSTQLPDGRVIPLRKFAPMGSCLCFPVLALVTWAILTAGTTDADIRKGIYVYGDDVIVPRDYTLNAIELLESFGLKVNRDKSCTNGPFRESCGMDAFQGVNVTPVRLRTVWSSTPSPDVYASWIAYANSFWNKQYYSTYNLIVSELHRVYGEIPDKGMNLSCPSLEYVPDDLKPKRKRWNTNLQKFEYRVRDLKSRAYRKVLDGWSMLLRYFTESTQSVCTHASWSRGLREEPIQVSRAFSVSLYTERRASILSRCWR